MSFSLIVPMGAQSREAGEMPMVFLPGRDGRMLALHAVSGLPLGQFTDIYFTVLREHVEGYDIDRLLEMQLRRMGMERARVVVLETPTLSQAQTIVSTIEQEGIRGPIFCKDADGYFRAEPIEQNAVTVYPLEEMALVDPRHKSYVAVDDMNYVTNIIERRVVSHLFNPGGYGFEDAEELRHYFRLIGGEERHIYLSHIIYAMLLEGRPFRPLPVTGYRDWTMEWELRSYQARKV